jgi:hypothetical protein
MVEFSEAVPNFTKSISLNVVPLHSSTQFTIGQQRDKAQPPFSRHGMEALSAAKSHGRWTDKGDSVLWPPRSHDFTTLVFFFWDCVSNYVYMYKIRDPNHLKARTREAAEQTTRDMLHSIWQEVEYRLDICRVTNGGHMET